VEKIHSGGTLNEWRQASPLPWSRGFQPGERNCTHGTGKSKLVSMSSRVSSAFPGGKMPPSTAGGTPAATALAHASMHLGLEFHEAIPLCTVKHSITRYRITLEVFHVHLGGASYTSPHPKIAMSGTRITRASETEIWLTPARMRRRAFTAAHKKILTHLKHDGRCLR